MAEISGDSHFLRFNVSGEKFVILGRKLREMSGETEELLPRFESLSHESRMCIAQLHSSSLDEYYFDRSPEIFRCIADYYRTGRLHRPQKICPKQFLDELEFWQISREKVSPCCSENDTSPNGDTTNSRRSRRFGQCLPIRDEFSGCLLEHTRRRAWTFLEVPSSSSFAKAFCCFSVILVIVSVLEIILSSMKRFQVEGDKEHPVLYALEVGCVLWFTFEYFSRLIITPKRKKYLLGQLNIIDALSILPFYLEVLFMLIGVEIDNLRNIRGILMTIRILRVMRVVRVFKLARYSKRIQFFVHSIGSSSREFGMLILYLSLCVLLFSTTMYYLEKDDENTKFVDIPTAFWWCIVSMTTVGYGDLIPQTLAGKLVGSLAMVSGLIVLAFPITLIVSNFSRFYMAADNEEAEKAPSTTADDELAEQLRSLAETDTLYKHAVDSLTVAHSKYMCVVEHLRKQLEDTQVEEVETSLSFKNRGFLRKKCKGDTPLKIPVAPSIQVHNTQETLIAIPGMGPVVGGQASYSENNLSNHNHKPVYL